MKVELVKLPKSIEPMRAGVNNFSCSIINLICTRSIPINGTCSVLRDIPRHPYVNGFSLFTNCVELDVADELNRFSRCLASIRPSLPQGHSATFQQNQEYLALVALVEKEVHWSEQDFLCPSLHLKRASRGRAPIATMNETSSRITKRRSSRL